MIACNFVSLLLGTSALTHAENQKTIVVGSGPGATGFIKQALKVSNDTFEWFEEGGEHLILEWPEDYSAPDSRDYLKYVKRTSSNIVNAVRWSGFGGGATRNSGGPLVLLPTKDERIQPAVEKYGEEFLAEELQSSPAFDRTSDAWIDLYKDAGYLSEDHFLTDRYDEQPDRVGYGATTFFGNGTRTQQAKNLLSDKRIRLNLHSRVKRVIFEDKQAVGVELVNGTKTFGDKVVLAAGVFGTYEILVHSGIGPKKDLESVGVDPVVVDETVGKKIGCDAGILFLHLGWWFESNKASAGADIAASRGTEFGITHWGKIAYDAVILGMTLRIQSFLTNMFLRSVLEGVSLVKIDQPAQYDKSLSIANGELLYDDHADYRDNLCVQDKVFDVLRNARRTSRAIDGVAKLLGLTYATPDVQCSSGHLVSNHHYHGGTQGITDERFKVKETENLYISDASVTEGYTYGAPALGVFLIGHAVADAVFNTGEV
ncbi:hypothetical protein ACHAWF_010825 [Thalassiosira exigua]